MILRLLAASLTRRFRQLALILASVGLAAAMVAALVSFSLRARGGLGSELAAFGPNVVVRPQVGGPERLPAEEAARIRDLPGVEATAGIVELEPGSVEAAALLPAEIPAAVPVLAVEPGVLEVYPKWRLAGSWPGPGQVLLGAELEASAPELAGADGVAGTLATGGPLDRAVFVPLAALAEGSPPDRGARVAVDRVEVRAEHERLEEVIAAIEGEVAGAEARPLRKVSVAETALIRRLTLLLQAFAAVSLMLALLSVAAATAALLEERRKEVGLLLALGYTGRRVAGIFAVELLAAALIAAFAGELVGELAAVRMAASVLGSGSGSVGGTAAAMGGAALTALGVVAAAMTLTLRRFERLDAARVLRGE